MEYQLYPDVPRNVQMALQSGIGMFQCIFPVKSTFPRTLCGLYGIKITENDTEIDGIMTNRPGMQRAKIEWLTGNNAMIYYKPINKEGVSVAWVADDIFWHNRVIAMSNKAFLDTIKQERLPNNSVKSGAEIVMEIECLRDELMEYKPIWKIIKNGKELDYFWDKSEADDFAETLKSPAINVSKEKGVTIESRSNGKIVIEESKKLRYKKDIEQLISQEKNRHQFGWTQCDEFTKHIIPRVRERIKDGRAQLLAQTDAMVITTEELIGLRNLAKTVDALKKKGIGAEEITSIHNKIMVEESTPVVNTYPLDRIKRKNPITPNTKQTGSTVVPPQAPVINEPIIIPPVIDGADDLKI